MKSEKLSKLAFALSVIAVVLSATVSLGAGAMNLWLAGTQWMLIGIVLGVWALFLKE